MVFLLPCRICAIFLTFFSVLVQITTASMQSYLLDTAYSDSSFFDGFDFWSSAVAQDPTHGFVNYLDRSSALTAGLVSSSPGRPAYMGVDYLSTVSAKSKGRPSVRITTQKSWTHGLFIADIAHMPGSICGVWPAFWMFGPNWPYSGEIDVIENISRKTTNLVSLHTGPNCVMTTGTMTGSVNSLQCDGDYNNNTGCQIASPDGTTYGNGFNGVGGGVYATEWTSSHIKVWFFPRSSIPSDITAGIPDPTQWKTPQAFFNGGSGCNIDTHFVKHKIVFDTTFCGDWAGSVWGSDQSCSALGSSCANFVAGNPGAFKEAYWSIHSVKVYQLGSAVEPVTTKTTRRPSSTSSVSSLDPTTRKISYVPTTLITSTRSLTNSLSKLSNGNPSSTHTTATETSSIYSTLHTSTFVTTTSSAHSFLLSSTVSTDLTETTTSFTFGMSSSSADTTVTRYTPSSSISQPMTTSTAEPTVTKLTAATTSSPSVLSCPKANDTIHTVPNGKTFLTECYVSYISYVSASHPNNILQTVFSDTLTECMEACSTVTGCVAFGWVSPAASTNLGRSPCFLVGSVVDGVLDRGVWGGRLLD